MNPETEYIDKPPNYQTANFKTKVDHWSYQTPGDTMEESRYNEPRTGFNIRIIDFLPTKFNPAKSDSDPEAHILGFRDYLCAQLNVRNLNDVEIPNVKLDMFRFSITGESRLWWESNAPFNDLESLETAFLKEYSPELKSRTVAAKALADLKYDRKQKICTFVNKLMRLNRALDYSDCVLKDRFMAAMPNDIRKLAKISNPKSLKEAVQSVNGILEDEGGTETTLVAQEETIENSIFDMAMSIQSLKDEVGKISKQMLPKSSSYNSYKETDYNNAGSFQTNRFQNRNNFQRYNDNQNNVESFQTNQFQPRREYRRGRGMNGPPPRSNYGTSRNEYGFSRSDHGPPNGYRSQQNWYPAERGGRQQPRGQPRQYIAPAGRFDQTQVRCYRCNCIGHIQRNCQNFGPNHFQ